MNRLRFLHLDAPVGAAAASLAIACGPLVGCTNLAPWRRWPAGTLLVVGWSGRVVEMAERDGPGSLSVYEEGDFSPLDAILEAEPLLRPRG